MKKTTVFFASPYYYLNDNKILSLFLNNDGSETMGNAYLPRTPILIEGLEKNFFVEEVHAVFTTVDEFLQDPPKYPKDVSNSPRESEAQLGAEEIVEAFNWYNRKFRSISIRVLYSVFKDGTLVYAFLNLKGGVK